MQLRYSTCLMPKTWFFVALLSICFTHLRGEIEVKTASGKVTGVTVNVDKGSVTAFLGIPFAEPPIGELRFKKPIPRKPWTGVWNATKLSNTCYQVVSNLASEKSWEQILFTTTKLSEDCLYINVWVPSPRPEKANVMVWIHGGAFRSGGTSLIAYDGRYLAYHQNIIVVSLNYRVDSFGFLALPGNPEVPGNMGLFDQRLALQWVQNNIAEFAGDPKCVTLFGQSAGAASISMHLVSPESQPLFQRAIMESGSMNAPWSFLENKEVKRRVTIFAERLGCPPEKEAELLDCLYAKTPEELIAKSYPIHQDDIMGQFMFLPVVDGEFLTDKPHVLIEKKGFDKKEILQGVNKDESSYFLAYIAPGFRKDKESLIFRDDFMLNVKWSVPQITGKMMELVESEYTDIPVSDGAKYRDSVVEIASDYWFICPQKHFANKYAESGNKVFSYVFDHFPSKELWPKWMGVIHGYEIPFVFGITHSSLGMWTPEEKTLSKNIMNYWTNFARTGNPNNKETAGEEWTSYTPTNQNYITLTTEQPKVKTDHRKQKCVFWNEMSETSEYS